VADETLESIATEIAGCTRCTLSATRTRTVPGEGRACASIVFIGEAPGAREDALGRPFVGASGKLLEGLLASIGMTRDDVAILNIVKCRPPENRDPQPVERAACAPFLQRQLAILRPRVIATLGRHALAVFAPAESISEVHGAPLETAESPLLGGAILFPLYHPAAALHNGALRPVLERDMAELAVVSRGGSRAAAGEGSLYTTVPTTEPQPPRFEREAP